MIKLNWKKPPLYLAIATLLVFISYYWFATAGLWRPMHWESYAFYKLQSEALLKGQLNLPIEPPQALLDLPDPYDPAANFKARYTYVPYEEDMLFTHDTSLFNKKIYMYFGVAPAVIFYIPIHFLTGHYPSSEVTVSFFMALSFFFMMLTIYNAIIFLKLRKPWLWLSTTGVILAWGTGIPFVISRSAAYETPLAFNSFLLSLSFWIFSRILNSKFSIKHFLVLGICLGLMLLTRPNMILAFPIYFYFLWKFTPKKQLTKNVLINFSSPIAILGILSGLYNYFRFGKLTEFGLSYQMSVARASDLLCTSHGFVAYLKCVTFSFSNYLFRFPVFQKTFPYITDNPQALNWVHLNFPYNLENLVGLIYMNPLIILGCISAVSLLIKNKKKSSFQNYYQFYPCLLGVIFLSLGVIAGAHMRYILEINVPLFMTCVLAILFVFREKRQSWALVILCLLVCWSLPVGFLLGLQGTFHTFSYYNPQLYSTFQHWFSF